MYLKYYFKYMYLKILPITAQENMHTGLYRKVIVIATLDWIVCLCGATVRVLAKNTYAT